MRLLYTIPDFWPHVRRGSERVVHDLGRLMTERGHEVTVVTRSPKGSLASLKYGFQVRYRAEHPKAWRRLGLDPLDGFALTAGVAALFRDADLRHAFYLSDGYGLHVANRVRRRPLVISLHGTVNRSWWEENRPRTHRWLLRALDGGATLTVMTTDDADRARAEYGVEPVVLMPGIFVDDFARPRLESERRTIVCAAAIDDPRKRIDLLLDAFALVARDQGDVDLLLVGDGDPDPIRRRLSQMQHISGRVRIDPTQDVAAALASCTVGALTSANEAFGLVVIEYLAAGMPAVVADDGGSRHIISPATGAQFAEGEAEACAAALTEALRLAEDPATDARCRGRARDFDWSTRVTAYEQLYRDLADAA